MAYPDPASPQIAASSDRMSESGAKPGSGATNPVIEAVTAYQRTAILIAAVRLDLFTLIGSGSATSEDLAVKTGAAERGIRILCDSLCVIGLLAKQEGRYSLPPASRMFLDAASPAAMGSVIDFLAAPEMMSMFLDDPEAYVRRGGSVGLANVAPDHPIWTRFARGMVPFAAPTAKRVAAYVAGLPDWPGTVLDVAAGHGLFGIEVAKALPQAVVTALDWTEVLRLAQANADKAGVGGRYRTLPGSAFDVDWGSGFELILLPNILHHFDEEGCVSMLTKAKASLAPGGRVLIVEFVPNPDRISPPLPALFALTMLATTPHGDAYTASELQDMAEKAGLRHVATRGLPPTPQTLVVLEG